MTQNKEFRALDNDTEKYINEFWIDMNGEIVVFDVEGIVDYVNATLEQWTGLTDKNSKKIFENDAVRYKGMIMKVKFSAGGWHIVAIDQETCAGSEIGKSYSLYENTGLIFNKVEVIGNIHTDKHLLEVSE